VHEPDTKVYIDVHSAANLDLQRNAFLQLMPGLNLSETPLVPPSGGPIRLAIGDRQALFRDALRTLIATESDLNVIGEAANASAVLDVVAIFRPNVLLLALPIDGDEGAQLLETLHSSYPETKIIIMADAATGYEYVQTVKLGTRGIVQKSASGAMLIKAIRKVQSGEFWLDRGATAEVVRQFTDSRPPEPHPAPVRERDPKPSVLSRREREIAGLVTQGYRNKELAEKLAISEQTVKNHMHNIFEKLGVSDRLELALYSIQHNLYESHD
jgi:two-component system nitrate/nitrite response regulator NarL